MNKLREELQDVFEECSVENWDGYGANMVTLNTYGIARDFVDCIPLDLPDPEPGAFPSGDICFDWYHGKQSNITVAVSCDSCYYFAGKINGERRKGRGIIDGPGMTKIINIIRECCNANKPEKS